MFDNTQEQYLQDMTGAVQRKGVRQAVWLRTGAAVFLGTWFMFSSTAVFYHLSLLALFIGAGFIYLGLSKTTHYAAWQAYLLVLLDAFLLTLALLYQPGVDTSGEIYLGQAFLYYFALLGLSVLLYIPGAVLWSAFANVLCWSGGQMLLTHDPQGVFPPKSMVQALPQEIFLMLLCGGVISAALWQMRQLMFQQMQLEREFQAIIGTERGDQSETYTDPLTGLGTRAAFERDSTQFTKVFAEGRLTDLTIAFIDLEGGRKLRETHGAQAHAQMLKTLAQAMRRTFRSSDMAYCFSEEQFALLSPGSSMSNADRLHHLLHSIVQQVHEQGFSEINARMGLSTLHEVQKGAESRPVIDLPG